jgi:predicted PurR-regulated permease PerM
VDSPTSPTPREPLAAWHRVGSIVTIVILVAALRFGEGVLVPFALATLFAFLLEPVVDALQRIRLGRVPAVVVTTLLATTGVVALGWMVWGQMGDLADNLSRYRTNVTAKWSAVRGETPIQKIERSLTEAAQETTKPPAPAPGTGTAPATPPEEEPQAVKVVPSKPGIMGILRDLFGPFLGILGTAGVVFVLTVFMLVYHEDLRDRFIRLVSRGQIVVTTQALAEASDRISRYLATTLLVNALYGIPVGVGLYLLGVPNALLWGLLATLLRFIPYLGPWIAAAFPVLLSMAVFPDWWGTAKVVGLFLVMELISNNVVEPWLYGSRTGLSPVAVIVAAVFWTWLWGTVGLFLSIPLTLVLAVAGRYVPPLAFLHVLLGDQPGLRPDERFYQRLVASDPDEASLVAEAHLKEHDVAHLYDTVVFPALRAAKHDRLEGRLDAESMATLRDGALELVDEIGERPTTGPTPPAASAKQGNGAGAAPPEPPPAPLRGTTALLLPTGDETSPVAARMLGDFLRRDGMEVRALAGTALAGEMIDAVRQERPDVTCVVGLLPYGLMRARHLCKRLRAGANGTRIVVALWDPNADPERIAERVSPACADRVAVTFEKAVEAVRSLASEALSTRGAPKEAKAEASAKPET